MDKITQEAYFRQRVLKYAAEHGARSSGFPYSSSPFSSALRSISRPCFSTRDTSRRAYWKRWALKKSPPAPGSET